MSLSDRIAQERQEIAGRISAEQLARDALHAKGRALMAELNERLAVLIADAPPDLVRWRTGKPSENTWIEISDYRPRESRRGIGRRRRTPEIKLTAYPNADVTGLRLSADASDSWRLNLDTPGDSSVRYAGRTDAASISEAVEWFESRLARGIAALQIWGEANPPGATKAAAPAAEEPAAAPPPEVDEEAVSQPAGESVFARLLKRIPLVIWLFLGFLVWMLSKIPQAVIHHGS